MVVIAKLKVGDTATLSDEYFRQGYLYWGKNLKYQSQKAMQVIRAHTKQAGTQDSLGGIVPIIYDVKIDGEVESFCEQFLKKKVHCPTSTTWLDFIDKK